MSKKRLTMALAYMALALAWAGCGGKPTAEERAVKRASEELEAPVAESTRLVAPTAEFLEFPSGRGAHEGGVAEYAAAYKAYQAASAALLAAAPDEGWAVLAELEAAYQVPRGARAAYVSPKTLAAVQAAAPDEYAAWEVAAARITAAWGALAPDERAAHEAARDELDAAWDELDAAEAALKAVAPDEYAAMEAAFESMLAKLEAAELEATLSWAIAAPGEQTAQVDAALKAAFPDEWAAMEAAAEAMARAAPSEYAAYKAAEARFNATSWAPAYDRTEGVNE
ncbi:MAG: hypothetical protein OXT69_15090 [Candidatus Poribacteria bacterium]|nr:hypothetical protein [Candidatus Poribacteria bacterium]